MSAWFPATLSYPKEDVFEICSALALAESALNVAGLTKYALRIGLAFEKAEAALVRTPTRAS